MLIWEGLGRRVHGLSSGGTSVRFYTGTEGLSQDARCVCVCVCDEGARCICLLYGTQEPNVGRQ